MPNENQAAPAATPKAIEEAVAKAQKDFAAETEKAKKEAVDAAVAKAQKDFAAETEKAKKEAVDAAVAKAQKDSQAEFEETLKTLRAGFEERLAALDDKLANAYKAGKQDGLRERATAAGPGPAAPSGAKEPMVKVRTLHGVMTDKGFVAKGEECSVPESRYKKLVRRGHVEKVA
jgi:hypothetical protein